MLDEPVAGMSVSERAKTAELLNRIIKGRSVLVIEHDMKFVEDIAHKVTVLHQGQILSEGTMEHVKNDPEGHRSLSRPLRSASAMLAMSRICTSPTAKQAKSSMVSTSR